MATPHRDYPNGFSRYADFISRDPEQSVYRRYRRLSSLNILYLQAELRLMEDDLYRLDSEHLTAQQQAPHDAHLLSRSFDALLSDSEAGASSPSSAASLEKMKKIRRLRELMKEYHEALKLEAEILNLSNPNPRVTKILKTWFLWNSPLLGLDHDLFDDEKDLVALKPAQGQDRLSVFLQERLGGILQRKPDPSQQEDIVAYFSEGHIIWIVNGTTVLACAILLVGAIAGLYFEKREGRRLAIIGCLTLIFALAVGTLTNARRVEIFASTAAYAAVLVVFVSGGLGTTP
ncbi:hypothetical protein K440DRAFT_600588 [Wilcoxina mikolae CBS 423.85]|nr:hypothetical protein K440DRAFT_600588 [Wilcoxina mikolae CBS 423.85]